MIHTAQITTPTTLAPASALPDEEEGYLFGTLMSPIGQYLDIYDRVFGNELCSSSTLPSRFFWQKPQGSANQFVLNYDELLRSVLLSCSWHSGFAIRQSLTFAIAGGLPHISATTWLFDTTALLFDLCRWQNVLTAGGDTKAIEGLFALRLRDAVLDFIAEHPFLYRVLIEAHDRLQHHFPGFPLVLELICDPEGEDDKQLVLSVVSALSPTESLARLHCFDDEWWLDAMGRASGLLCIGLEFR